MVNGSASREISVLDRGLQFGDGLFETLAVHQGKPLCWDAHLERLRQGCRTLAIPFPQELAAQLAAQAERLCAAQTEHVRAALKITVTRGDSLRGYAIPADPPPPNWILALFPWPDLPARHERDGVSVGFCAQRYAAQPSLAGLKHLNRLEQVLARRQLREGWAEALVRDMRGRVIEGTMSNLFLRQGSRWFTPNLERCGVAGVIRGQILEICAEALSQEALQEARIEDMSAKRLAQADELFLCNSLIGVWPIARLGRRVFRDFSGSRLLAAKLRERDCVMPEEGKP